MFNDEQLIIQDPESLEMEYQGTRVSYNRSQYSLRNLNDREFQMYLVKGDKKYRNGYQQPRTYLTLKGKNNFSTINMVQKGDE